MTDFLTDEEKAEQIKAWFKENGMSVAVGVTLAVGGLFGFKYWQEHQKTQSEEASALYSEIQQDSATNNENNDAIHSKISQLKSDYSSTPYAPLGAMIAAKQHATQGNNKKAITELQWAVENSSEKVSKDLAKLRLARAYVATKQFDKSSAILTGELPSAYSSLIEELKGDIHLGKNEIDKARESYDKALLSSKGAATEFLKMKRDDLGNKGT